MLKYLITPSLLNAYFFYKSDFFSSNNQEKVRQDFLGTLKRERFEPSKACQRGIDFENLVESFCKEDIKEVDVFKNEEKTLDIAKEISDIVKDGIWQYAVKKDIEINKTKFLLYGKCDVIKENYVYDIKTTKQYSIGKYQDSSQHLLYMLCSGLSNFSYLIAEGGKELNSYYREDYFYSDKTEQKLIIKINDFLDFLEIDKEAKELYYKNWKSRF